MKKSRYFVFAALIAFALVELACSSSKHSRSDRRAHYSSDYNYEVEITGVGVDGTKSLKVWGYGRRVEDAIIQAKKNAVAAAIFRGIPGGHGAAATPPILRDPNAGDKHKAYFEDFFAADGRYIRFINLTTDGMPSGQDRLRMDNPRGYKVAIYAQVLYDNLRRQLEADGIARRLDHGF